MIESLIHNASYESKLLEIFEEERKKLGIEEIIKVRFLTPPKTKEYKNFREWWGEFDMWSTAAISNDDGTFTMQFNPLSYQTPKKFRRRARHELYHIYREGKFEDVSILKKALFELASIVYEYFGIKL